MFKSCFQLNGKPKGGGEFTPYPPPPQKKLKKERSSICPVCYMFILFAIWLLQVASLSKVLLFIVLLVVPCNERSNLTTFFVINDNSV